MKNSPAALLFNHCRTETRRTHDSLKCSTFSYETLILILALTFAFHPMFTPIASESPGKLSQTFELAPSLDFTITASVPSVVPSDGLTFATSIIIVNPINNFTGTVSLSDSPLPADIACKPIIPVSISGGAGRAKLSCASKVAGTYIVTIIGVSGGIHHNATGTFTFLASAPPDFTIVTVDAVSFSSGSTVTANVTVISQGGFDSQVNISVTSHPSTGLSVSLNPQHLALGSGVSTATFSSSSPGDYTVAITGTSNLVSHTSIVTVTVTPASIPDFTMSASSSSINIEAGSPGTTRIVLSPDNGFAGIVSFSVEAPTGVLCSLSPTSLRSSGETTLTCNGRITGDYPVIITATGGPSPHMTTINVHVEAASPAAHIPTNSPSFSLTTYVILGTVTVIMVAAAVLIIKRRRRSASLLPEAPTQALPLEILSGRGPPNSGGRDEFR